MIRFERTHDMDLVAAVMRHPKVYPRITGDGAPPAKEFTPVDTPLASYIAAYDGEELLGVFVLVVQNAVCCDVHVCMLPASWGGRAREAAQQLPEWVWANTPFRRAVASISAHNRLALKFAESAGMRKFGVNEKSFLKHHELQDQVLVGLSPKEESWRHWPSP